MERLEHPASVELVAMVQPLAEDELLDEGDDPPAALERLEFHPGLR